MANGVRTATYMVTSPQSLKTRTSGCYTGTLIGHLFSWSRARNSQETLTVPLVWCWHLKSDPDNPRSALSMGLDVTALFATPAKAGPYFTARYAEAMGIK